jgi:predicted dehydrogenase
MGAAHAVTVAEGRVPGLRLTAVANCERADPRWAPAVSCYKSAEALIASGRVDAILVATPHPSHKDLCIRALKAGLHLMVEKPVSIQTRDAEAICQARMNDTQVLAVMFQQRTNPIFQELRNIVQRRELGDIRRVNWIVTNWFRTEEYYAASRWRGTWAGEGGGMLLNQCPHQLDLWQWIFGMPRRVRAFCGFGRYHNIEVEDDVTAYLEYESGTTGVFIASTGESPGTNRLEITGERGRLVYEGGQLHHQQNGVEMSALSRQASAPMGAPTFTIVNHSAPDTGGRHADILINFVEAIVRGAPLIAPACEGVRSLELANAMILSAWDNCTVELPLDVERYACELSKRMGAPPPITCSFGAAMAGGRIPA